TAVLVIDPVDRELGDAEAVALGQQEQLGVEEPAVVLHLGKQSAGHDSPDRLEAALGVAEATAEHHVQQSVVAARQELPAEAPVHPGTGGKSRAEGEAGVPDYRRRELRATEA